MDIFTRKLQLRVNTLNKNLERKITIYALAVAATFILALIVWSLYTNDSIVTEPEQVKAIKEDAVANKPREEPIRDNIDYAPAHDGKPRAVVGITKVGPNSFEELGSKVKQFKVKVPDQSVLPPRFRAVSANYENSSSTSIFQGQEYSPEFFSYLLWDKEISSGMFAKDVQNAGGIYVGLLYALGSNQTVSEIYKQIERDHGSRFMYFHGYPTLVKDGSIQLYQFNEHISYQVTGQQHSIEVLLKIMESLING